MKTKRSNGYKTRQREIIYDYIGKLGGKHVTASDIAEHFRTSGIPIGRTTIYRHLEKLETSGKIRRFAVNGTGAACYQYVPGAETCNEHFHLKCEDCGGLIHLECEMLDEVLKHITTEHEFKVNGAKSVIYGRCVDCGKEDL